MCVCHHEHCSTSLSEIMGAGESEEWQIQIPLKIPYYCHGLFPRELVGPCKDSVYVHRSDPQLLSL
jgi:hypothetical protein